MSIYNRKMFKQNARNALNNSAGVQNFSMVVRLIFVVASLERDLFLLLKRLV